MLAESPGEVELLAGGTDVVVGLNKGTLRPVAVVDLKRLDVLHAGIEEAEGVLRVGALTVLSDLIRDERVRRLFPALVEAAAVVGSVQIRNRATLAGNVCNASPAADTVPALLVYGARVSTLDRTVPLEAFFTGPGQTVLEPGELVTAIELPFPPEPSGSAFVRVTRRRGFDLGTVSVACLVTREDPPRFGLGAVAARPLLVVGEEHVASVASPISDVRASREYREAMLVAMARRALELARRRLAEAS